MQAISETAPVVFPWWYISSLSAPPAAFGPSHLDFIWEKFGAHVELGVDPLKKHRDPEPQKDLLTIHPEVLSNR